MQIFVDKTRFKSHLQACLITGVGTKKKILSPHEESKLKNFKKIRTSDSALSTELRPLKNVAQKNASKLEREREHA